MRKSKAKKETWRSKLENGLSADKSRRHKKRAKVETTDRAALVQTLTKSV